MMESIIEKLAAKSDHKQHHHVVVLMRGGATVATGYNHGLIHAEDSALRRVWPDQRKGLKAWSFRLRRDGKLGMAKPCVKCQKLLRDSGIKVVYYSNGDGQMETMKL